MAIQSNFPAIKPTLLLDFSNTEALDSRITFTRASTATYYGTQTAKAEENLFIRSQDFAFGTSSTTGWNKTRTTVGSAVTAPDGTTTAEPVTQAAGQTTSGFVAQSASVTANLFVVSVFAKPNGKDFLRFVEDIGTGSARSSWINVSTGVAGTTNAGHTITVTAAAQGFYRVSIALTPNATRTALVYFSLADTDNSTTVTDSGGLILWGAQLEQRSAVSAYTPTTTQAITNYIPRLLTAASGVARFDHNPTTFESLGLLIEESRTNLVTYSEQFDDAAWTKTRASITANTIVAPSGELTGDALIEDTTATNTHNVGRGISFTSGTTYTVSVFAKATTSPRFLQIIFPSGAFGATRRPVFDLLNGTALPSTDTTASIQNVGNGWYRCVASMQATSTSSASVQLQLADTYTNGSPAYTGNGFSGLYIWGAQVEAGAFPTSYIPTVASQVTRAADAASMTGTNFSSWYNAGEGTVYAEAATVNTLGTALGLSIDDGTNNNRISVSVNGSATASQRGARLSVSSGGSIVADIWQGVTPTAGQFYKISATCKVNDFALYSNTSSIGTDTAGAMPLAASLSMSIGSRLSASDSFLNGTIKKIAYYPARVTNAQLQALTS